MFKGLFDFALRNKIAEFLTYHYFNIKIFFPQLELFQCQESVLKNENMEVTILILPCVCK